MTLVHWPRKVSSDRTKEGKLESLFGTTNEEHSTAKQNLSRGVDSRLVEHAHTQSYFDLTPT